MKEAVKQHLTRLGYRFRDYGTFSTDPVDYPDIALAVANAVPAGGRPAGILVDGAGIGSAMAANKVPGVRAAPCVDAAAAKNAREHNDANVLTLGARFVTDASLRGDPRGLPDLRLHGGAPRPPCPQDHRRSRRASADDEGALPMTDRHLVEAIVRAVLAQVGPPDPPCACHAVPGSCCPDRLDLMVAEGAERFGLLAAPAELLEGAGPAHRPHPAEARREPGPDREALPRGPRARVRHRVHQPLLGAPLRHPPRGQRDRGLHGRGLPPGRDAARGEGLRGRARGGRRGGRGRHGDERGRPEVTRPSARGPRRGGGRGGLPPRRRA